ncbi:hypothetical protein VTN77DRAFT_6342 [Rasamsonia byssochlamydoides]|uniref:uncharacterized protein n=1 Tax=Rasamsonia byssochlamydoides TaxID=89139 RepID=UPI003743B8AB
MQALVGVPGVNGPELLRNPIRGEGRWIRFRPRVGNAKPQRDGGGRVTSPETVKGSGSSLASSLEPLFMPVLEIRDASKVTK